MIFGVEVVLGAGNPKCQNNDCDLDLDLENEVEVQMLRNFDWLIAFPFLGATNWWVSCCLFATD